MKGGFPIFYRTGEITVKNFSWGRTYCFHIGLNLQGIKISQSKIRFHPHCLGEDIHRFHIRLVNISFFQDSKIERWLILHIRDFYLIFIFNHSKDKDFIGFSDDKFALLSQLRTFNYERIYHNEQMRQRKETIDKCIRDLFDYFRTIFNRYGFDYEAYAKEGKNTAKSFANYMKSMTKVYHQDPAQIDTTIADYIAGMTDSFALSVMEDVILPNSIKFFS